MKRQFGDCALFFRTQGQYLTIRNTDIIYYGYPRSKDRDVLYIYCGFILYPNGEKEYFDRLSLDKDSIVSIGVGIVPRTDKENIAKYCEESDIDFEDITLNMLFNEFREG